MVNKLLELESWLEGWLVLNELVIYEISYNYKLDKYKIHNLRLEINNEDVIFYDIDGIINPAINPGIVIDTIHINSLKDILINKNSFDLLFKNGTSITVKVIGG